MRLFLDSSVLLAGCGRSGGASRFILDHGQTAGWDLLTSNYVLGEVDLNIPALGDTATRVWAAIRPRLERVADVLAVP